MKLFTERILSSIVIDQPGHFTTQHTGENHEGKSEFNRNLKFISFEDKSHEEKAVSVLSIDTCPTEADALDIFNTSEHKRKTK